MFEYGNPEAILADMLIEPNDLGHTPIDDFEHFCSVTGCKNDDAWAKVAFVWEWTDRAKREAELFARIRELEANSAKAAELVAKALGMIDAPR